MSDDPVTILPRLPADPSAPRGCWLWVDNAGSGIIDSWVQTRKSIHLEAAPNAAPIHVTADTRYRLFVNGRRVLDGPARGFQEHWFYDTVDIARYLRPGENVLAILAHNLGIGTHSYIHQGFAGLLLWGNVDALPVATDASWRIRACPEHLRHQTRTSIQTGWQEFVDGRKADGDWTAPGYDDARWATTSFIGPRPVGCPPWHTLAPRDVPLLREEILAPARLHLVGTGTSPLDWQTATNLLPCYVASNIRWERACAVDAPAPDWVSVAAGGEVQAWCLDFGREVLATTILEIESASEGDTFDCLLTEGCHGDVPAFHHDSGCEIQFAHRYTCRTGAQRHETYTPWGWRYVVVIARRAAASSAPALRFRLSVRHVEYPLDIRGGFRSSDETLNRVHAMCVHTQQLCLSDAYVDCPGREQAMWWGDAHCHFDNSRLLDADDRPFVRGLRLMGRQTLPNGLTYAHAPTKAHECVLPDFTLMWVETHWQHWWHSGSTALFIEHREKIGHALEYFRLQAQRTGLLARDERYWLFLDWANTFKEGIPTLYNIQYLRTLELAAVMFDLTADPAHAQDLRDRASALRGRIAAELWDADAALPFDGIGWDGQRVPARTLHNRVAAIRAGLWPEHHADWIERDLLPFVRGPRPRGSSPYVVLPPDAPPPDRGALTPYFMQFTFQALARCGQGAAVIDCIRRWWGDMHTRGLATTEEIWDATPGLDSLCHAWTAHPIQFLSSLTLGIRQSAAGWREIVYAPVFGEKEAEGAVDTPLGLIRSRWRRLGEGVEAALNLPAGCTARLELPGIEPLQVTGNWRGVIRLPSKIRT